MNLGLAGAALAALSLVLAGSAAGAPSPTVAKPPAGGVGQPPPLQAFEPPTAAAAPSNVPCAPNTSVTVVPVSVCGVASPANPAVIVYRGLRYATAPRWQAPVPYVPTQNIAATTFGSICPQMKTGVVIGNEDCLFLNVWAPATAVRQGAAAKLPVMVFIHGGAFIVGAGSAPLYDSTAAAAQGVVAVTLNYRLGALGFMAANALTGPGQGGGQTMIGGNFGLQDQQAALTWVRNNIKAFGGDPTNITLYGESAGAMSVALHNFDIPSSSPMFSKAIMESNPAGIIYNTPAQASVQGNLFVKYLCENDYQPSSAAAAAKTRRGTARLQDPDGSCKNTVGWLGTLTASQIVSSQIAFYKANPLTDIWDLLRGVLPTQSLPWQPVVDGRLVTGEPYAGYAPGTSGAGKTLGIGVNKNEGVIFTAMAYLQARRLFNAVTYDGLLRAHFPGQYKAITAVAAYQPQTIPSGASFENGSSAALSTVMTDYAFTCGNLQIAALAQSQGSTVYTYQFTQPPFFDLYNKSAAPNAPDGGACAPAFGNVCHANELPYVFNTLPAVNQVELGQASAPYTPTPGDVALAKAMNTAWVNFSAGNYSNSGWTGFAPGKAGVATLWQASGAAAPPPYQTTALDQSANCTAIWLQSSPYAAASAAHKR